MSNVAAPVWEHATEHAEDIALRGQGHTWSYRELRDKVATFAGALTAHGVEPGDRVVLVAPSVPEFTVAYYAIQSVGGIAITMNTMATVPELGYVLQDSGARLVVTWEPAASAPREAAAQADLPCWLLRRGGIPDQPANPIEAPLDLPDDATAVLLYTSGTTGQPKGVELTVANLVETARTFAEQLDFTRGERFATALPLFHVFGQCVCLNTVMRAGGTMVLQSPFDPAGLVKLIRDERLNVVSGVPTMWNAMLHVEGDFGPDDFASLRLASSGGASLPVEVIRAFEERFGCSILEGYGLTESTGASTYHAIDIEQRPGTVGIPLPGTTIEVRDPDGARLPPGEVGEVFMSGPWVMKGYWGKPDATAADLRDGWLRTGDLGSVDANGYLSIVDRAKDLVIRGGYNVYPREVEEVLYQHPDVVEAAVIGVPDEHYGQEVAAVVVSPPGVTIDPEELRAWLKQRLSAYKVPHLYQFVETLPKGATGKVLKRAITWTEAKD